MQFSLYLVRSPKIHALSTPKTGHFNFPFHLYLECYNVFYLSRKNIPESDKTQGKHTTYAL